MSFSSDVKAWTDKTGRRALAVFRSSAQALIQDANTPGPSVAREGSSKGGKMPVDTGFLRNSVAGAVGQMPSGPSLGDKDATYTGPVGEPPEVAILRAELGETLYLGWTAQYAQAMEARYGFMRSAAQKWPEIVAKQTAEVERRYP